MPTQAETGIALIHVGHQLAAIGTKMIGATELTGGNTSEIDPKFLEQIQAALGGMTATTTAQTMDHQPKLEPQVLDEEWFQPGNKARHLTPKGAAHIVGLFEKGMTPNQAATAMGIRYNAARLRYDRWAISKGLPQWGERPK